MDPLPDSQVALERQLRTGEVHGRIQGKNKEEYTESNSSPLHSGGAGWGGGAGLGGERRGGVGRVGVEVPWYKCLSLASGIVCVPV